jgi:hypothetical protein
MDKTLHAIYDDVRMAQQAIQQLIAIGIEQHAIQLISASSSSGIERDHIGGYADSREHLHSAARDHIGGYADTGEHRHSTARDHVGGYADGEEHMHNAARDRVGSFASVEPARKRAPNVSDMLKAAGLSPEEADSYVTRMDAGAAVLFVQVDSDQFAQVGEILHVA